MSIDGRLCKYLLRYVAFRLNRTIRLNYLLDLLSYLKLYWTRLTLRAGNIPNDSLYSLLNISVLQGNNQHFNTAKAVLRSASAMDPIVDDVFPLEPSKKTMMTGSDE